MLFAVPPSTPGRSSPTFSLTTSPLPATCSRPLIKTAGHNMTLPTYPVSLLSMTAADNMPSRASIPLPFLSSRSSPWAAPWRDGHDFVLLVRLVPGLEPGLASSLTVRAFFSLGP